MDQTPLSTAVRVTWTSYGAPALDELARVVESVQSGDPLAPVTVVTPSPAVAVATRRALARHRGAVVGIGFVSFGALAEMIAAPELAAQGIDVGVDREMVVAALRSALAEAPGILAPIRHHRSTWEVLAATILELDAVGDAGLDALARAGGIAAEVARLHGMVRRHLSGVGPDAVTRLATEMVRDGRAQTAEVGPVVLHLPDRIRPGQRDLLEALSARVPVTVLAGSTGSADVDSDMAELLAPFEPPPIPASSPLTATAVSANDIDDEVRAAVRRLLALADGGVPLDRLALVHPAGSPYARVVHDVLASTGVPFSGPSTTTLAQTAVGRLVLRVIDVVTSDHGRQEVIDLWSTGIVVDGHGAPVPFAALDERSRRLGIFDGADDWNDKLDIDDEWVTRRIGVESDERELRRLAHRLDVNLQLRTNLERLRALTDAVPTTWADVAPWVVTLVDTLCGPRARRSWPDAALDAEAAMITNLGRLASLDSVEPDPDRTVIFDTIVTALDRPAPRDGRIGTGIVVTTYDEPPVIPLHTVAAIGLVEGHAPRSSSDDVLLGDRLRADLGLENRHDRRRRERRGFAASLATATDRIVTTARHDQRSGRALVPSRWFVDTVEATSGERPDVERLMEGKDVAGVDVVPSFSSGLAGIGDGAAALNDAERTFAALVTDGGVDGSAAADAELLARAELVRSRASRAFTRFDGNLDGEGPAVTGSEGDDGSDAAVLSPTSLETYAACPRRWFFSNALGLNTIDRPEAVEQIKPTDRGTLVHLVLERFFGEMMAADAVPAPGHPWPAAAVERAAEICAEECEDLERRGLTGHPLRWEHDRDEIHKVVRNTLAKDVALRSEFGVQPVAVEFTFGRGGEAPLVVDLGDGRTLALAGQADRVDVGDGRAVVWDYKFASTTPFAVLSKPEDKGGDPLGFGRKLQLVAYGLAAADRYDVDEIHAWYWFLPRTADPDKVGYPISDDLQHRFRTALRVLADGIGSGRFPARPGEMQWHLGTFDACGWCDFDEICPADRDEEWERVRFDPSLRSYRTLVEDGSAQLVAEDDSR